MFALFFLSGISGLIYQIVWTRMLVLVFGNTLLATSTVLSAYMGGLAAGSYVFGKYIDKRPRPLVKIYSVLEAGIGVFALAFPVLLMVVTPLYSALYRGVEGNVSLLNLARFSVCFALICVPTFMMGATLPVLLKRFVVGGRTIGHQVGFLYGLNTAGAVAGSLACGYFLLKALGMRGTTWVAVGINLGVALVAWVLARGEAEVSETEEAPASTDAAAGVPFRVHSETTLTMVLIGIGVSGFCALAYEVFWARMLNLFLHNNIYSFTAILATFLTGIALGSLIYSKFLSKIANQVALFVWMEIGIGVMAYATPFVFSLLHKPLFNKFSEALTLAKTSIIMLPPTVLMGIALPMAVQIWQRGARREGTSVGTVYAVNTVGAILGAFAAGFILIPYTGLHRGVIIVAALNVLAGFLPLVSLARPLARPLWTMAFVAALIAVFVAAPRDLFRGLFERAHPSANILHYKEGKVANVVVYDFEKSGYKDLHLNAVEEASSRLWHVQLFKMLGILPPMVHDEPGNALMIAFGAGMSAGACLDHVTSLDCVDLNPDIDGVAEVFTRENLDVINNPKLNRVVNDGRNALLLDPQKYSLIISDATNPKMFDSWTLYTEEFYELVKERLEPDGVFCQWVLIPLPGDAIKVILKTFRKVYPHASFWCIYGSSQCLMLGTPERLEIDYQELTDRLDPHWESSGLSEFGIDTVEKFLSFFMIGEDGLGRLLEEFDKTSTDDLPHAQFQIEQDRAGREASLDLVRHLESIVPYLTNRTEGDAAANDAHGTYRLISRALHMGFLTGDSKWYRQAAAIIEQAGMPADPNIKSMLGYGPEKRRYFLARVAERPDDANAHNYLGFIYWQEEDYQSAIDEFTTVITLEPRFANAHANLARVYVDAGMYDEAVAKFMEVRQLNPAHSVSTMVARQLKVIRILRKIRQLGESADLYMDLGKTHFENGDIFKSLQAVRSAARLDPGHPGIFMNLAVLYERIELTDQALEAYERAQALSPGDSRVAGKLVELAALRGNETASQQWLNRRVERFYGEPAKKADDHPESCRLAAQAWDEFEFDDVVDRGNLEKAASLFEESIAVMKDDIHAYRDAATIYEDLGDHRRAASLWRRLSEVSPDGQTAEVNARRLELLAAVNDDGMQDGEKADALSEIGALYRINGDVERAIVFAERSLSTDPRRSRVWLNLAESLVDAGRYEDALEASERALEMEPGLERAVRLIKSLGEIRNPPLD